MNVELIAVVILIAVIGVTILMNICDVDKRIDHLEDELRRMNNYGNKN